MKGHSSQVSEKETEAQQSSVDFPKVHTHMEEGWDAHPCLQPGHL